MLCVMTRSNKASNFVQHSRYIEFIPSQLQKFSPLFYKQRRRNCQFILVQVLKSVLSLLNEKELNSRICLLIDEAVFKFATFQCKLLWPDYTRVQSKPINLCPLPSNLLQLQQVQKQKSRKIYHLQRLATAVKFRNKDQNNSVLILSSMVRLLVGSRI